MLYRLFFIMIFVYFILKTKHYYIVIYFQEHRPIIIFAKPSIFLISRNLRMYYQLSSRDRARRFHTDESRDEAEEQRGWMERSEASRLFTGVMQDIHTLSAVAETEVAFKDYQSLA